VDVLDAELFGLRQIPIGLEKFQNTQLSGEASQ
jgi:hypothetical protein